MDEEDICEVVSSPRCRLLCTILLALIYFREPVLTVKCGVAGYYALYYFAGPDLFQGACVDSQVWVCLS